MTKKCKSCQTDIDAKAKKCPHCQADQRSWFGRHPILTGIIVLIVVFGVIGAAGGSKSGTQSSSSNTNANTASTGSNKQDESQKVHGLNEMVQDGDLAFTATNVTTAKKNDDLRI
jgi:hypothetical protein